MHRVSHLDSLYRRSIQLLLQNFKRGALAVRHVSATKTTELEIDSMEFETDSKETSILDSIESKKKATENWPITKETDTYLLSLMQAPRFEFYSRLSLSRSSLRFSRHE